MRQIEIPTSIIKFPNDHVAIIESKEGAVIDKEATEKIIQSIEEELKKDYILVVNRIHEYSLQLPDVYAILNQHNPIKGLCIVLHREITKKLTELDKALYEGPFLMTQDLEEALNWAKDNIS